MKVEDYASHMQSVEQRCSDAEAETMFARLDAKQIMERAAADVAAMSKLLQAAHAETDRIKVTK